MEKLESPGERIKFARILFGLTQQQLASLASVPFGALNRIEQEAYKPSNDIVIKISSLLRINPSYIQYNNPPIFTTKMAFIIFEPVSWRARDLYDPANVGTVIEHIHAKENISSLTCLRSDDNIFLVIECMPHNVHPRRIIVAKTDSLIVEAVKNSLQQMQIIIPSGGALMGSPEPSSITNTYPIPEHYLTVAELESTEAASRMSSYLYEFYKEAPTGELISRMNSTISFAAGSDWRTVGYLRDFFLDLSPIDIISPPVAAIGKWLEVDKTFSGKTPEEKLDKITEYMKSIGLSREDIIKSIEKHFPQL